MLIFQDDFYRVGGNQVSRKCLNQNFRIFESSIFNLIVFAPIFFLKAFAPIVLDKPLIVPLWSPDGEIRYHSTGVNNVAPDGDCETMGPDGFIPISLLLLGPIPLLHTSGLLWIFLKDTFLSPCPNKEAVLVALLEWMMDGAVALYKYHPPPLITFK